MKSDDELRSCLAGGGELGQLMRTFDWSSTPVGPIERWPQSLRSALGMVLHSRFAMYIAWGPEFIGFYNDMCRPILGANKHPALGKPTRDTFCESWHMIGPLFEQVMAGEAVGSDDWLLPLDRSGYLEECHFIFSYSPIRDDQYAVGGVLVTVAESTARVLSERRARTFRDLCLNSVVPETSCDAWKAICGALAQNAWDLPFALLYELDAVTDDATLVAATPDPFDDALAPHCVSLSDPAAAWPFGALLDGRESILVEHPGAPALAWPRGAWRESSQRALVLPVSRPGRARPYGFLVAGISSGRALDESYTEFLHMLALHAGSAVTSARAYADERRRAESLAELDRAKTIFFSNVSHEFRTPLSLILGPVEDLAAGAHGRLSLVQVEQLGVVERNALRLLKLVNNLLDFAQIESGRACAHYESVDLALLTAEVASVFRSAIERAGLQFTVACTPTREAFYVDRDMWEKIVLNLLSNALKFTSSGQIALRLWQPDPGWVDLEVEDSGIGIPDSELGLIFRRFHRVQGVRGRDQEGSGIGLSLVRELARLHGGSVDARSVEGEGSCFRVRIKAGIEHLASPPAGASPTSVARTHTASTFVEEALRSLHQDSRSSLPPPLFVEPTEPVPAETAGARVLVVDDNADMREYLRRLLTTRFRVELASDGIAALAAARAQPPELVITDVMMPNLDGFGLLRELRADPRTQDAAVMMLSARAGEEARIEGLAKGANDYLTKPFSGRELIARANSQIALRRVRQALDYNRAALYELFMQAPAPICVLRGPDLVFEMANPSVLRMIGRNDVLGKPLLEAVPELAVQRFHTRMLEVLRTGESYAARESLVRLGGESSSAEDRYFTFVFSPLRRPDGVAECVMMFASEVTDQVRARVDLEDARRRAEDASRAKDEFMAMLGHELRNPLAPITTALELMQQRGPELFARERTIIGHQVQHLTRLVDDLLDVSRITRGKIHLRTRAVEMAEVVSRAIELASPLLDERRHRLRVDVPSGLLVLGDELRLAQVVSNLLTNAAKYTDPGGDVSIHAQRVDSCIVLCVQDTGIGITSELLPRIFDLFVQGARPQAGAGGLGLGLTLVRSLTELHGGSVHVRSAGLGHGSEFELKLPSFDAPDASADRETLPSTPPQLARGQQQQRRVMIVDDNEDAAELLAEGLRRCGHEVEVAFEAPRGIDLARAFKPDVALLDLGLPVMDGYELARRLHELPEVEPMLLIAVTGYGQDKDRHRSNAAGFARHLVKPVDLASVDEHIRQLLPDKPAPS